MAIDMNHLRGLQLGNCELEELIGYGGMGVVYQAQQSRPRRTVAVKVLMPELLPKSEGVYTEFLSRFRREADAIAALDHVNIIPIYAYGEQEQIAYLVMPYVTGGTLRQLQATRGILPLDEAVSIVEQVAAALDYAHAHGIVHRDLKPGNILFHADGRLLLSDFGIAKVLQETSGAEQTELQTLTTTGTIIGTPEYLSPEQATANPVDRRTDIYSLGVVLFQMLCGRVPFTGATPVAVAVKHAMEEPPSLRQLNAALPPGVEAVVAKALAKRPEDRYATAGDFARALQRAATADVDEQGSQTSAFFARRTLADADALPVAQASERVAGEVSTASETQLRSTPPAGAPAPRRRRGRPAWWAALLCASFALLLVGGAAIFHFGVPTQKRAPAAGAGRQQSPAPAGGQTATPAASASTIATPTLPGPSVAVGKLLYGAALPACDQRQRELWSRTSAVQVSCTTSALKLTNTGGAAATGVFLRGLPGGAPVPDSYVLEVRVRVSAATQGEFGIYFRTQSGANHRGTFSFLVNPSGSWVGSIYDDATGAPTKLFGRQSPALASNGYTTLDVVVDGGTFSLYFNGVLQGGIESGNYPGGDLGLTVQRGTAVQFKDLALYALPQA